MKKNLIGALVALFTLTLNHAATSISQVWRNDANTISPNERVQFLQFSVSTDTAESLDSIILESIGLPLNSVFSHMVARNGFGRIIGRVTAVPGFTKLELERTVLLPGNGLLITVEGESLPERQSVGRSLVLVATSIVVDGKDVPISSIDGTSSPFTVAKQPVKIGKLTARNISSPSAVTTGSARFLGGFLVDVDPTENLGGQVNIGFHATGGSADDLQNLKEVILSPSGGTMASMYRMNEYGTLGDWFGNYQYFPVGQYVYVGVFADIGQSFSGGGTIAVSSTPSQWRGVVGYTSGKFPLLGGTVVGPTITVLPSPSQGFSPVDGSPLP